MLKGHVDVYSPSRVSGWAVDLDAPERPVEVLIEVNGEVVRRVLTDQRRPDVENAVERSGSFGFSAPLNLSQLTGKAFRVLFGETGETLDNGDRSFHSSAQDIIVGKDGWYFHGRHEEISLINLITKDATDAVVQSMATAFKSRYNRITKKFPFAAFIVPEKAVVYPMYLPETYTVSRRRLVPRISEICDCINYPEIALRTFGTGVELFHKNDSHLNDFGALLLYSLINYHVDVRYGIKFDDLPVAMRCNSVITGDLSHELLSNMSIPQVPLDYSLPQTLVYKNKLLNYGAVRYYRKENSRGPRLYVSGTSSALQLTRFFSYSCSEILFHFNHDIDYALVEEFDPDLVINIVPEKICARTLSESGSKANITYHKILEERW